MQLATYFWTQVMCKMLGKLSYFTGTGLLEKQESSMSDVHDEVVMSDYFMKEDV